MAVDVPCYLEISVVETHDLELSKKEILELILADYTTVYHIPLSAIDFLSDSKCKITFPTQQDFWAFYDVDYKIYEYIYENLLMNIEDFPHFLQESVVQHPDLKRKENKEAGFYLIIKLTTNYLEPLRRNFNLIYKINEIFGDQVVNEETAEGYLRLYKTKRDFETNLLPINDIEGWKEWFTRLDINLAHPVIQKFLTLLKSVL